MPMYYHIIIKLKLKCIFYIFSISLEKENGKEDEKEKLKDILSLFNSDSEEAIKETNKYYNNKELTPETLIEKKDNKKKIMDILNEMYKNIISRKESIEIYKSKMKEFNEKDENKSKIKEDYKCMIDLYNTYYNNINIINNECNYDKTEQLLSSIVQFQTLSNV